MPQPTPAFKNRILSGLAPGDLALLLPHLHAVDLPQRKVLYDIGARIEEIYFMETGAASVLTVMEDGASIEVGMVGFEGVASISAMLGDTISPRSTWSSSCPAPPIK